MTTLLPQAIAAHQSGQLAKAEELYRAVLAAEPQNLDAMALLGLVLGTVGRHDEAIALTGAAVAGDPQAALFWFHHGSVLMNAKRFPESITAFRDAIRLQPAMAQAHYNLANVLRATEDWDGAITAYRQTVTLMPNHAEAHNNLALSLVHERLFDEALTQAKKTVEVAPNYGEGWRTLCNIAEQAKDYALAVHAGEQCTRLMPDSHFSWFGYGVALCRLNRYEEAIPAYQRALELKPDRADIWDNLGQTYQSLNRLDEAEATFRKTIEVAGQSLADEDSREVDESEYGHRHWHLALMELLRGKYPQGFARYRARFKDVKGLKRPAYSRPLWRGEDLNGKTIVITDEQGFGDTLMLARYLPLLKHLGARMKFSVHPVLEPLFRGWSGADEMLVHGGAMRDYDYHASVFDLPHRFVTTLQTIPAAMPYLPCPTPDDRTGLDGDGHKKIGVVWGGSPLHSNDAKRSVPLPVFAELFDQPDAQFFSLNRDLKEGDAERLPDYPLVNLVPRIQDFADAARFIGQMDLVITCDTATAHLAGGMGKPVWILLPFAPDWRWLTDRSDSPWYPTARLFRQPKTDDWAGVVAQIKAALKGG